MDNLTHSLTAVMLSRAGLNRVVPHATAVLLVAANLPDIDVVAYATGNGAQSYLEYHRGLTHAIAATPLVALLPVLIVRLLFRKTPIPWLRGWLVSMAGVASHWMLDATNVYGIRLWLPFSEGWPSLDCTHIVDVWIWGVLLLAALWPLLSGLVSSEIGARKTVGRGWAILALLFLFCYNTTRWFLHNRAVTAQEARIYNGVTPRRVLAMPTALNPLEWRGIVETSEFWVIQQVSLATDLDPAAGQILHKPAESPAIAAARKSPEFQTMTRFSNVLHWRQSPAADLENGFEVKAVDLRLGFSATAIVDGAGKVQRAWISF